MSEGMPEPNVSHVPASGSDASQGAAKLQTFQWPEPDVKEASKRIRQCSIVGLLCGLAAAGLYGSGAVILRQLASDGVSATDLVVMRYGGYFVVALAARAALGDRFKLDVPLAKLLALLTLGGPPYHMLISNGYGVATAGQGTLLLSGLVPAFSLWLSWLWLGERAGVAQIAGVGLAFLGLMIVGFDALQSARPEAALLFGTAACSFAALNVLVRAWGVKPLALAITMGLVAPIFLPVYLWDHAAAANALAVRPITFAAQVLINGVGAAFLAMLLNLVAVAKVGPTIAGALQSLTPLVALVLGAAWLSETLNANEILGTGITLAGVVLVALAARPTQSKTVSGSRPASGAVATARQAGAQ